MALNADDLMSSYRPYSHHWLDTAIQETLLPGSPWHQIYDRLSQVLAKRIQPELTDRDKRAAIFDMLGSGFLQKYLSKWMWDKPTKDRESCSPEERKLILQATQLLLKEKLDQAATDCGYLVSKNKTGDSSSLTLSSPSPAPVQVPEEVIDTISHMDAVFRAGMHRYLMQEGMTLPPSSSSDPSHPTIKSQLTNLHDVKPSLNHREISPLSTPPSNLTNNHDKGSTPTTTVPNCWGQTSDLLGKSLCAILRRDPSRLDEVCRRLMGRQLPGSLRHKIWNEIMLRNYKDTHQGEKSSEWFLRQNFAKTVMRGKAELGITMTTNSSINGLLETAIQEKYSNTPCLLKHRGQTIPKHAREALNILYVFDRSYQPYFIHWLYPLHLALIEKTQGDTQDAEDLPYELALQLHLLRSYTFPRWSEILTVAQDVMQVLEKEDPDFFNHLVKCSKTNVKLDPKDFFVHQIQQEQHKASSLTTQVQHDPAAMATGSREEREMLASPLMFLRKWLGEGFVGVCDTQTTLFIWDQCFMSGWNHQVLSRLCLSLLLLLRKNFMDTAQDYHVMKQIFVSEPCKLYTKDIQKAFQHLEHEGNLTSVPTMNRRPVTKPERKPSSPPVTFDPSHYAHLIHSIPINITNKPQGTALPLAKATPPSMVSPTSQAPPVSIAPPTSVAPPPSIATQSKVSLPITKPHPLSQASQEGSQRHIPSISSSHRETEPSGDQVEGSETSLQHKRKDDSPGLPSSSPLIEEEPVWVPFDTMKSADLPEAPTLKEGFDLYIDAVRFLPDNATIVKVTVTGRFTTEHEGMPFDIKALPDLTSLGRCPKFTWRVKIAKGILDQLVEIRVWTVDRYTHQVVVLGVYLLKVYNDKTKKLNIGGHQMRLRSGYPASRPPILPRSLDHLPSIPGSSILLRLLPCSEEFIDPLPYISGYYQSDLSKPTESEINVIEHYKAKQDWKKMVKDSALELAKSEDDREASFTNDNKQDPDTNDHLKENKMADSWSKMSDEEILTWMTKRLEAKHQPAQKLPPLLEIERCVDYERDTGVAIKVRAAYGLQAEKCYSIVLTRILPGPVTSQPTLESGDSSPSRLLSFLTKQMDLDSLMKAPRWKDKATVLRPVYDEQSVLLLQFFSLEVVYKVDPSGRSKGVVHAPKGKGQLTLNNSSSKGWGLLPIFDRNCVIQGTFIVPIFQNVKDKPYLKGLMDSPSLESWMRVSVEKKLIKVHPSHPSAIVSIWDGHFYQGQNIPLPRRDYFLHIAGDFNKFSGTSQDKTGHPLNQIILRSLPSAVRSEGTRSERYLKEKQNFEEFMHNIATELVEDALLTTGQAPLMAGS
ncbi:uncharacterized protein LOC129254856 [Lytechinus pictus]|uniref:uncharacterized protein LOC129254856 n=1 Tax=Lytechinus pictus TaxID=7653 RepID=UPI0030B9EC3D